MIESEARTIIRGTGTLKGYMPFKIGREPIRFDGFEKAGFTVPKIADPVEIKEGEGVDVVVQKQKIRQQFVKDAQA